MLLDISVDSLWHNAFPDRSRPQLYVSDELNEDGYQSLTNVADFLTDNPGKQKSSHLYVLAANNQEALEIAQKEWMALESLANRLKHHDVVSVSQKEPQAMSDARTFEEHKEAVLYGYKYESKRKIMIGRGNGASDLSEQEKYDLREEPEPFAQGGLIPSEKQFKTIITAAKTAGNELNPDNFEPYQKNFAFEERPKGLWIPKMLPYVNDLPAHPKTRARTRQLDAYPQSSRLESRHLNSEKGLVSRDQSDSASRAGTPLTASPAPGKRKLEAEIADFRPRKKHPNQYTKRREAAEAAARAQAVTHGIQTIIQPAPSEPSRKKHPNQHTKRREREEAERQGLTALIDGIESRTLTPPKPAVGLHMPVTFQVHRQPPVFRAPSNPPDFRNMTNDEKLACQWDATSLVECVKHDHYWLHPNPEMADRWKSKVLAGDYPVRTLAMLRKWDYWQKEGTNKRPRNTAAAINARMNDEGRQREILGTGDRPVKRSRGTRAPNSLASSHVSGSPLVNGITLENNGAHHSSAAAQGLTMTDSHTHVNGHTFLPSLRPRDTADEFYPPSGTDSADFNGTENKVSTPKRRLRYKNGETLDRNETHTVYNNYDRHGSPANSSQDSNVGGNAKHFSPATRKSMRTSPADGTMTPTKKVLRGAGRQL